MQVPSWLQASDLFLNSKELEFDFQYELFGSDYIREDTTISSLPDFVHVMRCIDFWGVIDWPESIYGFILEHPGLVYEWKNSSGSAVREHTDLSDHILQMLLLYKSDVSLENSNKFVRTVCELGSVNWLRYADKIDLAYDIETAVSITIKSGELNCLKYLNKRGYQGFKGWTMGCVAAAGGHLACLKYLHENGWMWAGEWIHLATYHAAKNGHIYCLEYAYENGCPWDESVCAEAARNGHLNCLKYAHVNGCLWNEATCSEAAGSGNISCLIYAHENGCPWDELVCFVAAGRGHLQCLQYAHQHGCPWSAFICITAAATGHLNCLQYAHENSCPWNESVCSEAARNGHLDCLQYARRCGCPWNATTFTNAVKNSQWDCVHYSHNNGCPRFDTHCFWSKVVRVCCDITIMFLLNTGSRFWN